MTLSLALSLLNAALSTVIVVLLVKWRPRKLPPGAVLRGAPPSYTRSIRPVRTVELTATPSRVVAVRQSSEDVPPPAGGSAGLGGSGSGIGTSGAVVAPSSGEMKSKT